LSAVTALRLMQVGLGGHGRNWARRIVPDVDEVELVAYVDSDPYALDIASNGKFAVVGNNGYATGDVDTMSLIDMEVVPPRVADTINYEVVCGIVSDPRRARRTVIDG